VVSPKAAGQEWAEYGITVNAHCPGIVGTAMWDLIDEELAKHMGLHKGKALGLRVVPRFARLRLHDRPVGDDRWGDQLLVEARRRNALTLVSLVIIVSSPTRRDGKEAL
jgi:NAD(P)-dependent dehydrogenase (short-subunit alcohol dehydrogenase family)